LAVELLIVELLVELLVLAVELLVESFVELFVELLLFVLLLVELLVELLDADKSSGFGSLGPAVSVACGLMSWYMNSLIPQSLTLLRFIKPLTPQLFPQELLIIKFP